MKLFMAHIKKQDPAGLAPKTWGRISGMALAAILSASFSVVSASSKGLAADREDIAIYEQADPKGVVLTVQTPFSPVVKKDEDDARGYVRLSVYDSRETFLEEASLKVTAPVNEKGEAILPLGPLTPGDYAFVAYYDKNGDRKLNRGLIGRPKEPLAFSNGVRPRVRKPKFKDAKIGVAPGSVIVLQIKD